MSALTTKMLDEIENIIIENQMRDNPNQPLLLDEVILGALMYLKEEKVEGPLFHLMASMTEDLPNDGGLVDYIAVRLIEDYSLKLKFEASVEDEVTRNLVREKLRKRLLI